MIRGGILRHPSKTVAVGERAFPNLTVEDQIGVFELKGATLGANMAAMKSIAAKKRKDEGELLDQATNQLLRAVKEKLIATKGKVDEQALRKAGYSERVISRLQDS